MTRRFLMLTVGLCAMASAAAQDNDFLTDYSKLQDFNEDTRFTARLYKVPNAEQRLRDYNSIMVDQPEIFIAADSKYKGAKGDQLKALADIARLSTIAQLEASGLNVVDTPSTDTLYMRWAIADLYLQKKKRGILSYTPLGMVVHTTKSAATRDLWKKIDIAELHIEIELTDVVTGEVIVAGISHKQGFRKEKGEKADLVTWQELEALFDTTGARLSCGLTNTGKSEEDLVNCSAIWIEAEVPETK